MIFENVAEQLERAQTFLYRDFNNFVTSAAPAFIQICIDKYN